MACVRSFSRVGGAFLLATSALFAVSVPTFFIAQQRADIDSSSVGVNSHNVVAEMRHEQAGLFLFQRNHIAGKTVGSPMEYASVIAGQEMRTSREIISPPGATKIALVADVPKSDGPVPLATSAELGPEPAPAVVQARNNAYSWFTRNILQIIFGVIYFYTVVVKYPVLEAGFIPNDEARKLQQMNEVTGACQASFTNCCLSCCCSGPRAAHTLSATGILNYWAGLLAMTCFPCCTLWFANSFSDLNDKLGGVRKDCCTGCVCAFCCSCCVIAHDAASLDLAMKTNTGICGVTARE